MLKPGVQIKSGGDWISIYDGPKETLFTFSPSGKSCVLRCRSADEIGWGETIAAFGR